MYAAKKAAGAMRASSSSGASTPMMSPGQDSFGYGMESGGYDQGYDVGGISYNHNLTP